MGWQPAELRRPEALILSTQGGVREPDGTPLALGYHTGPLGSRAAGARGGRDAAQGRAAAVCRLCHRPVRRPHAGHHRHDGQPAVSQRRGDRPAAADPIAAHASRGDRRGDLRQGPAGDADGAGRVSRPAGHRRARRRHAAAHRRRRCRRGADHRRALCLRAALARGGRRAGLPRVRVARRRLPVPRHGRDLAGGGRSARPHRAARGAGPVGPAHLDRRRAPVGARGRADDPRGHDHARCAHRRRHPQRDDRARGLRRIHEPAAARAGDRARRGAARARSSTTGSRSTARCRAWWTCCPTGRIRPCASTWPAACPR